MRAKVLKQFTDKNNRGLVYKVGTEIEITEARLEEINSTQHGDLVEEIKEDVKEEVKEDVKEEVKEVKKETKKKK